ISSIRKMEVIRGPAGSLYGTNTGGAVLIYDHQDHNSRREDSVMFRESVSGGSWGMIHGSIGWDMRSKKTDVIIQEGWQRSDGYRLQSKMVRANVSVFEKARLNDRNQIGLVFISTGLQYQTPGGLTYSEMLQNPRQARPHSGSTPGAEEQKS